MWSEDHFPNLVQSRLLRVHFLDQTLGLQAHKTCHMLPLDQIKHRSNSGTIQASNSFDFHEWAY